MKKLTIYKVTGVLQFAVPYDVNLNVEAFSVRQAIHKTFLVLTKDSNLKSIDKKILYNSVKKLQYTKI